MYTGCVKKKNYYKSSELQVSFRVYKDISHSLPDVLQFYMQSLTFSILHFTGIIRPMTNSNLLQLNPWRPSPSKVHNSPSYSVSFSFFFAPFTPTTELYIHRLVHTEPAYIPVCLSVRLPLHWTHCNTWHLIQHLNTILLNSTLHLNSPATLHHKNPQHLDTACNKHLHNSGPQHLNTATNTPQQQHQQVERKFKHVLSATACTTARRTHETSPLETETAR